MPNVNILKNDPSGRLFINKIRDSFAFSILFPCMDPLQSNKNINSPFALFKSISKFILSFGDYN